MMLDIELIISCHVSENPIHGPKIAQTNTDASASRNAVGLPTAVDANKATFWNQLFFMPPSPSERKTPFGVSNGSAGEFPSFPWRSPPYGFAGESRPWPTLEATRQVCRRMPSITSVIRARIHFIGRATDRLLLLGKRGAREIIHRSNC